MATEPPITEVAHMKITQNGMESGRCSEMEMEI